MDKQTSRVDAGKTGKDTSSLANLDKGRSMGQAPDQNDQGRSAPDTYPAENAALPGARMAIRMDNKYPTEPPGGGEGEGLRIQVGGQKFKPKADVSGFSS